MHRFIVTQAEQSIEEFITDALTLLDRAFGKSFRWRNSFKPVFENDIFEISKSCGCGAEDCADCGENSVRFLFKPTGATAVWFRQMSHVSQVEGSFPDTLLETCLASHPQTPSIEAVRCAEEEASGNF